MKLWPYGNKMFTGQFSLQLVEMWPIMEQNAAELGFWSDNNKSMFRVTNCYILLQRTEEATINKDKCSDLFGNSQFLTALQLRGYTLHVALYRARRCSAWLRSASASPEPLFSGFLCNQTFLLWMANVQLVQTEKKCQTPKTHS